MIWAYSNSSLHAFRVINIKPGALLLENHINPSGWRSACFPRVGLCSVSKRFGFCCLGCVQCRKGLDFVGVCRKRHPVLVHCLYEGDLLKECLSIQR